MDMILLSIVVVAVTGMVLGICIAVAAKKFAVEADPRIDEVTGMLPGANCGGCGFAGCADLAKNIVEGKAPANKCPVCTPEAVARIAECIAKNESAMLPVSAVLEGQYGLSGLCLSIPTIVGQDGAETVLEIPLSPRERAALLSSAQQLQDVIRQLELP